MVCLCPAFPTLPKSDVACVDFYLISNNHPCEGRAGTQDGWALGCCDGSPPDCSVAGTLSEKGTLQKRQALVAYLGTFSLRKCRLGWGSQGQGSRPPESETPQVDGLEQTQWVLMGMWGRGIHWDQLGQWGVPTPPLTCSEGTGSEGAAGIRWPVSRALCLGTTPSGPLTSAQPPCTSTCLPVVDCNRPFPGGGIP